MTSAQPYIQVINLKRQTERKEIMARQMAELGVEFQFLEAIDYKNLSPEEFAASGAGYSFRMLRALSPGEVACSMSHQLAMQNIVDSGQPYGVILEDDATLPEDFHKWVSDLSAFPQDWEMIKLSGLELLKQRAWKSGEVRGHQIYFSPRCTIGAACYILTAKAAKKLAKSLEIIDEPFDRLFANQYRNQLIVYEVLPFPVGIAGSESTISDRTFVQIGKNFNQTLQKKFWRFQQSMGYRRVVLKKVGLMAALGIDRGIQTEVAHLHSSDKR